jgi:ketosteroid isomerase-like protein
MDEAAARALAVAFTDAWNAHDIDAALGMCTADVVFESTDPAPDGRRLQGQALVRTAWQPVFADERGRFDIEDLIVAGDRFVQCWRYEWGSGHVRGVDVVTLSGGLIAEKRSYVKG